MPEPDEKPKSEPEPPAAAAPADEPAQEPGGPDASLGMMRSVFARLKAKPAQPDEPAPEPPADATAEAEPARGDAEDAQSLGMLRSMFARLKMKDGRTPHEAEAARPKLLPSFDMAAVAALLREGRAKRVIVMCGAGISVSAGIPDFRTPGTGLYDNLQKYQLPHPQAIFEIDYFREHPGAFYQLAREMWPGQYRPTPTHAFLRLLHEKGALLRCFTQNIDSLESSAGLPREMVVAAHGNFDGATCVETGLPVPIAECRDAIAAGEPGWRALAERYGGLVKVRAAAPRRTRSLPPPPPAPSSLAAASTANHARVPPSDARISRISSSSARTCRAASSRAPPKTSPKRTCCS